MAEDRGGWRRVDRLERYGGIAGSLALLSDRRLRDLVDGSAVVGTGIGGATSVVHVDGTPVFVKQIPLTDLEHRPEHVMSTANLFDLPLGCQYGVGSPSFGVWRELAALVTTSSWVLAGRTAAVPLLYHWRVLDDSPSSSTTSTGDCTPRTGPRPTRPMRSSGPAPPPASTCRTAERSISSARERGISGVATRTERRLCGAPHRVMTNGPL